MPPAGNENAPPGHGSLGRQPATPARQSAPKTPGGDRPTTTGARAVTKQVLQEQNSKLRDENDILKGIKESYQLY
ncbi:hypothetical protein HYDPIDRAFT_106256 [Hydnomerulius pinastri MD-312]|nr:hypothetical protein HYDPIDRAFT_106256 [Hydnomerulius pinastri MD-312]